MNFLEFKNLLFERANIAGFDECEIYFSDGESISISVYEGEVEKYNLAKSFGLSFRGKIDGKMGYSYTEILDEAAIEMLIKSAKNSVNLIENDDETFIYGGDKIYSKVKTYSDKLENINPGDMIGLALDLEKEAKNYCDKVKNINGCKISYSSSNYGIYNSKGLELTNKDNILTSYIIPVVQDESGKNDGVGYVVASSLDEVKPKEIAAQGVKEALSKLGGKSIPSGTYNTIIYNEAMVQLLETFAGTFSGDAAQKGLSLLKG